MPVLKIQTNVEISSGARTDLLKKASTRVAQILGKPERYVMVMIEPNPHMLFAGEGSSLAYLELKSIGLPGDRTSELSDALSSLINDQLAIPQDRIYIEFANAERHMWGWSGSTF
ncbi:MAG: phenylpyruvate tautomerase MIF-related protein [Pseudomonadota bacterium]